MTGVPDKKRMMNILLTGATGYIGSQLKERLLQDENVRLRLFVRNAGKVKASVGRRVDVYEGSTFDKDSLRRSLCFPMNKPSKPR
jgi:uncharacterized protein YbjT (DUF2867 family)